MCIIKTADIEYKAPALSKMQGGAYQVTVIMEPIPQKAPVQSRGILSVVFAG